MRNGLTHWMERGNNNSQFEYKDKEIYKMSIKGSGIVEGRKHLLEVKINTIKGELDLLIEELYEKLNINFE